MNLLLEVPDKDIIIIGITVLLVFIIFMVIFKKVNKANRVLPISEEERFDKEEDNDVDLEEKEKAKAELERVYAQMSADLNKEQPKDEIDAFEKEQEENAIISYKELMKQANMMKKEEDIKNEKVEVSQEIKEQEEPIKEEIKEEKPKAYQGFKSSDIISPIYGIQKKGEKNYTKQDNDKFLNSLKEFRKNL